MNDAGTTPEVGETVWWATGEQMAQVVRVTPHGDIVIYPLCEGGVPTTTRACFLRRYES